MADLKGTELMVQAEKKMKSVWPGSSKYEEAAELYDKAAAQFKIAKDWEKAGEAYERAAEASKKAKNDLEVTEFYSNAAQAYKKVNAGEAVRLYNIAVEMHIAQNRFSTAAKMLKTVGEICEDEKDYSGAIEAYQKCADYYLAEDQSASAGQALVKVAHYAALIEEYSRAIEILEQVAANSLDSSLTSWSCKDYYFKALLCHLGRVAKSLKGEGESKTFEEVADASEKYKGLYPMFEDARESKFIDVWTSQFHSYSFN